VIKIIRNYLEKEDLTQECDREISGKYYSTDTKKFQDFVELMRTMKILIYRTNDNKVKVNRMKIYSCEQDFGCVVCKLYSDEIQVNTRDGVKKRSNKRTNNIQKIE
jgi:hypothetical protein